ncbi:MAG TPA: serine hydrolase domain-containing protein [Thermoanaerobaculia bacterium]|jgi:CubicO group peptidase (beta-lactamase class C family)|nr:serine hydrolase domain-containing protein [Thermoanaerobaculia bacterium]
MRNHWRTALLFLLFCSAPLGAQNPVVPATPPTPEIPAVSPGSHALTAADVETFLDGFVPLQLEQDDIAGATISIVRDGKLLFAKGYGYADVAKRQPVVADATLFRPGSISKLFTWTAVMQLAEQKKLDLDRDVNAYLDFRIPDAYGRPITLKNLLTHTPGFEEVVKDLFVDVSKQTTLGQYLKTHIPRRIYPPGTVAAYSNYGAALAGYIVERVSGRPFNQYVDENIFKPLGMTHSTLDQPLPKSLAAQMSKGYGNASESEKPFEAVGPAPAGSLSSTATDMAAFMIAHLQEGEYAGARLLRPETVRLMHSRLYELNPAANGMAYGFYEESRNGPRIIGHGGDTEQFHSALHLIPDANLGFFLSYNSAGIGKAEPRGQLWGAFLNRYYRDSSVRRPLATAKEHAQSVAGSYLSSRRAEGSLIKAAGILGEIVVTPSDDGTITASLLQTANGKPMTLREEAPFVFRDVEGADYLAFQRDSTGRMEVMYSPYPLFIFQRVGVGEDKQVLLPVVLVSLGLMVLTLLLWPIAALVRRHYGRTLELTARQRRIRLAVKLVLVLNILFVAAIGAIVTYAFSNIAAFNDDLNKWIYLAQLIGVLGAIGTLVVLYDAASSWLDKSRTIWYKLNATILALACLGLLWFVFVGNLLRFTSKY